MLAGGQDRIYPKENGGLLGRIVAEGGVVVCEMPFGWEARGRDFPRRNRIVSGLSYGVVVIEAARRSGSLITARFALEQGREVFAVPGSPMDPRAEGTNDLIREGATLCASAEHVVAALEPLIGRDPPVRDGAEEPGAGFGPMEPLWEELDLFGVSPAPRAPADESSAITLPEPADEGGRVIALLGPSPVPVDDLARQSGLPVRVVQRALLELELSGRLDRHGGNAVSLPRG